MRQVTSNRLLTGAATLLAGYWAFAALPWWSGYMNGVISGLLLVWGLIVAVSWGRDAWKVLRSGVVQGPQLALLGVTTVAIGSAYSGGFGLMWSLIGEPMTWLGTPQSAFGRYLMAIGFALQAYSPEATVERFRPLRWHYMAFIFVMGLAVAFAIGTRYGTDRAADNGHVIVTSQADCPVIGSVGTRGKIYHTRSSPYRRLVTMETCFATEEHARIAGYRSPR